MIDIKSEQVDRGVDFPNPSFPITDTDVRDQYIPRFEFKLTEADLTLKSIWLLFFSGCVL